MENTIILTVHNKEKTIKKILKNLFKNTSKITEKIIVILDGCTDKTEKYVNEFVMKNNSFFKIKIIFTNNIWETKANNVGLREVTTKYVTIVQDDMLIKQKYWDRTLINKLSQNNVFSISGRAAYNLKLRSDKLEIVNIVGREYPFSSSNLFGKIIGKFISYLKPYWIYKYTSIFSIRKINNRGPLVLRFDLARDLEFFDEEFAPFELDDVDLCLRAFRKYGLYSSCLPIYYEEINGSKKNNNNSKTISKKSIEKNTSLIIKRHSDLLN